MRPSIRNLICVLIAVASTYQSGKAQEVTPEKFNIYGGFGLPELFHLGVRMQRTNGQIGLSLGYAPTDLSDDEHAFTVTADYLRNFGGESKWSTRQPWFWRAGLVYLHDATRYRINHDVFANIRIGREFNISKRSGVAFDLGVFTSVFHRKTIRMEGGSRFIFSLPDVLPSAGLVYFYRL